MKLLVKVLAAFGGVVLGITATAVLLEVNGLRHSPPLQAMVGLAMGALGWLAVSKIAK